MMPCNRCGVCCREYAIAMKWDEDYARFLSYHGLSLRSQPGLEGRAMEVYGQSKCMHLRTSKEHGTSCAIYDERPHICRAFTCARAKEGK